MTPSPHTAASEAAPPIPELIGSAAAMQDVYRQVRQVAATDAGVLLLGEPGTGKQLVARAIHRLSPRSDGPLVRLRCGAFSAKRLDAELFGPAGRFEAARGGTLVLDEIDAAGPRVQSRLLDAIAQREFSRRGDGQPVGIDVRVIATAGHDLAERIDAGRFREDLFYRLAVVTIALPPLRDRLDDVPRLLVHFLEDFARRAGRPPLRPRPDAIEALQAYDWPGNVGQLLSYVHRAVVLADGDELTRELLPEEVLGEGPRRPGGRRAMDVASLAAELVHQGVGEAGPQAEDLHAAIVDRVERELIAQVLTACEGVQTKAAARLGINRNTLHKKLKQYGLEK